MAPELAKFDFVLCGRTVEDCENPLKPLIILVKYYAFRIKIEFGIRSSADTLGRLKDAVF